MEFKEALIFMLHNDYVVMVDTQPVFTNKFQKEWAVLMKVQSVEISTQVIVAPTIVHSTLPAPIISRPSNEKEVWNNFVERAEVPWRVTATDGGQYTVRQFSSPAAKKLCQIIRNPNVNYTVLVESTKNYYKTVTYKTLLSKYLLNDIWLDEYKEFEKKGKGINSSEGGNRFED